MYNGNYVSRAQVVLESEVKSFEATIVAWLDMSGLADYLTKTSVRHRQSTREDRGLLAVRQSFEMGFDCLFSKLNNGNLQRDEKGMIIYNSSGHSILFFWQCVGTTGDNKFEYGTEDNLCYVREKYFCFQEGLNQFF